VSADDGGRQIGKSPNKTDFFAQVRGERVKSRHMTQCVLKFVAAGRGKIRILSSISGSTRACGVKRSRKYTPNRFLKHLFGNELFLQNRHSQNEIDQKRKMKKFKWNLIKWLFSLRLLFLLAPMKRHKPRWREKCGFFSSSSCFIETITREG
jgi:hypothetical protein